MSAQKKKLSIISFSGDFDKLVAAFTLATGSAAVNYEVNLFFTFWGLNAVKKKQGRAFVGTGFLARFFNFLMGGVNNVPLSRLNFLGLSPKLMTGMMKKKNVATLKELMDAANALGINLYACEMSMHILGMEKETFIPEVKDVIGVATFLELSEGGDRIFIWIEPRYKTQDPRLAFSNLGSWFLILASKTKEMALHNLDITKEHCPMTFVKTKLALAKISDGDVLEVLLNEGEPLNNVPKSATEQGFKVLNIEPVQGSVHKVSIQKWAK